MTDASVPVPPASVSGARRRDPAPLGAILLARHWLEPEALHAALSAQRGSGARLGEELVASGDLSERQLAEALAEQRALEIVDPVADPPDPALVRALPDPVACVTNRIVPWRHVAGAIIHLVDDPAQAEAALRSIGADRRHSVVALATPRALEAALASVLARPLAEAAETGLAPEFSVRSLFGGRIVAALALPALAAQALAGDERLLGLLAGLALALGAATSAMRLAALIAGRRGPAPAGASSEPDVRPGGTVVPLSGRRPLPMISVLVPLYRERRIASRLIAALSALDYPRHLLDVKLVVEEDDTPTRHAIGAIRLPSWIRIVVVPSGAPRTKPRALNFALGFCRGEIVGILDAEDRPEPGQLIAIADALAAAPASVACVQCQLSYYNAAENWIARCFQMEYSIWFDVLLRGFRRLGLPIPLGGTSVYFRREALDRLGGWDAHNVTEDADLGIRLARHGMRCEVIDSVTGEEANCWVWPWIRQRSRWLKGYLLTWLSHIRRPGRLWAELGPLGFVAFNVLFLGGAASYLMMPAFWAAMASWVVSGRSLWQGVLPDWALWPLALSLAGGQIVMLACAVVGLRRRRAIGLIAWVPMLPVYWTLGAVAAWKAVLEIAVAPFFWDKTRHGVSRLDASAGSADRAI